jgi:hypothetical protein
MNMAEHEGSLARFVGKLSPTLRTSLLIREFARLSGRPIDVRVGQVLGWSELEPLRDRKALLTGSIAASLTLRLPSRAAGSAF